MAPDIANHDVSDEQAAEASKQHVWFVQTTIFVVFIAFVMTAFVWLMCLAFIRRRTRLEIDVPLVVLRHNEDRSRSVEDNGRR
jgi:heme/copper-type cytochrome/quinol oxidase subunit 2